MKNKILIFSSILPKELTHLYGLVDKIELSNPLFYEKIMNFYNNKNKEINLNNENKEFYEFIHKISKKYKDQIIIVNQEVDNKYNEYNIPYISLQGNMQFKKCFDCNKLFEDKLNEINHCPHCSSKNVFFNISLKEDKQQYKEIVELLEDCQYVIFLGNVGQIDPTLFLDEIVDSLYINKEDVKYEGGNPYLSKEAKEQNLSSFFDKHKIIDNYNEAIELIDGFIESKLSKNKFVNMTNPYKNNGKEIIEIINNYFQNLKDNHNIENKNYDRKMMRKIKECFPFVKKLPELYVYNIWFSYCYDTKKNPLDIRYDDLFYDMLLVYSYYKWEGVKKYFTKRPKISLTLAYNDDNTKEIEIFKNLLLKKNYI